MQESENEKILFQYIMNYKAYRRIMVFTRVGLTAIVAGGLAAVCIVSITIGIILAAIAIILGVIFIIAAYNREAAYTVYNTRVVLKLGHKDNRKSVPLDSIVKVSYRRALYEKDLGTGTVTITAKTDKGGKKRYKMKHIFNAAPVVEFLKNTVTENENENRK